MTTGKLSARQAVDLPATSFIPVVLGILHYSKTLEIPSIDRQDILTELR